MKRILTPMSVGLMALLLIACQITAGANKGSAANKMTGQDDVRARMREAVLGLRELLYCDRTLDGLLEAFPADDPGLKDAIADIRRGSFREAAGKLAAMSAQQNMGEKELYWAAVAKVREAGGDNAGARKAALAILSLPAVESRWKIQAWKILRELGYVPSVQEARTVLGVVVEMGKDEGAFIVAGYADGDARMLWTTGGGLLGPMQDHPEVAGEAKSLTKKAEPATTFLPIKVERPLPTVGRVRFAILTPAGMHVADEKEIDVSGNQNHRMYPVYLSTHKLLTQLFRIYQSKEVNEVPAR